MGAVCLMRVIASVNGQNARDAFGAVPVTDIAGNRDDEQSDGGDDPAAAPLT